MVKKTLAAAAVAILCALAGTTPCRGEKDTLVVGVKMNLCSLATTDSSTRQALVLSHNWADTLVYRDPATQKIVPCLAKSFRVIEPNLLEFTLRKGVRFHNGEPLDAEAVRFSMGVFQAPDSLGPNLLASFKGVSVVDGHTVRMETTLHPRPALEALANMFFIYAPDYYKRVGRQAFGKSPVGTGPYRFVSWAQPDEIRFEANPDHFGAPKCRPRIQKLIVKTIPEQMLRLESLLTGKVDLLRGGSVSPEHIEYLENSKGIVVKRADIIRNNFLIMDARGRSGVDFFTDRRVRRAVNHAINRQHIVEDVLAGCVTMNHGTTTPRHFGHEPGITVYPHDPRKARALLAQAGYPRGLGVDLYAARDESVAEAVAEDLGAVGIEVNIHWMGGHWDALFRKLRAGRLPLALLTWGSYSIMDASAILNPFFLEGDPLCQGTTPAIEEALHEADRCGSEERRRGLLSEAQKHIAEEAFWAPLYFGNSIAAMREDLDFSPAHDEIDRYFLAAWRTK